MAARPLPSPGLYRRERRRKKYKHLRLLCPFLACSLYLSQARRFENLVLFILLHIETSAKSEQDAPFWKQGSIPIVLASLP